MANVGDIAAYIDRWRAGPANNKCDTIRSTAVYRTVGDASVKLYLSQPAACTTTTKRREQNLFVRSGKSETELALVVL